MTHDEIKLLVAFTALESLSLMLYSDDYADDDLQACMYALTRLTHLQLALNNGEATITMQLPPTLTSLRMRNILLLPLMDRLPSPPHNLTELSIHCSNAMLDLHKYLEFFFYPGNVLRSLSISIDRSCSGINEEDYDYILKHLTQLEVRLAQSVCVHVLVHVLAFVNTQRAFFLRACSFFCCVCWWSINIYFALVIFLWMR